MQDKNEMTKRFKLLEGLMRKGYTSEKELAKLDVDQLMVMFPDKMDDFKRGYALVKAAKAGKVVEYLSCESNSEPGKSGEQVSL